jgi:hypothetical protein
MEGMEQASSKGSSIQYVISEPGAPRVGAIKGKVQEEGKVSFRPSHIQGPLQQIGENTAQCAFERGRWLKRQFYLEERAVVSNFLSIFSDRIFESKVDRGIPSRVAEPRRAVDSVLRTRAMRPRSSLSSERLDSPRDEVDG